MNYRHAFHAGNFADVFKHVLLARILAYLMRKDAALRYIDTHAGVGFYDLGEARAERTGEWRGGIGRLAAALPGASPQLAGLLQPYLDCLGPLDGEGRPNLYPGSPAIAQAMLRKQDRLTLCELHGEDVKALAANIGRDTRAKAIAIDGYVALNAYVPPRERRGLVFIDPPFEDVREFERLAAALPRAAAKWATGTYALWHPVKDERAAAHFHERLARDIARPLDVMTLSVGASASPEDGNTMRGCAMVVVNPPHALRAEALELLPFLARAFAPGGQGAFKCSRLNNG